MNEASVKLTLVGLLTEGGYQDDLVEKAKELYEWIMEEAPPKEGTVTNLRPIN